MRGGDKFWDFRTFNPPISKLNWANEYAERAEKLDNTLVVRNTYLDVPIAWLGQQFIEEAEDLRNQDARAYVHEYLGIAIGTGGDIFPNASNLDMDELVSVGDRQVPMWETFDNIYCGIDWGWKKSRIGSSIKWCERKQKRCRIEIATFHTANGEHLSIKGMYKTYYMI